jgi:hypothetical protein
MTHAVFHYDAVVRDPIALYRFKNGTNAEILYIDPVPVFIQNINKRHGNLDIHIQMLFDEISGDVVRSFQSAGGAWGTIGVNLASKREISGTTARIGKAVLNGKPSLVPTSIGGCDVLDHYTIRMACAHVAIVSGDERHFVRYIYDDCYDQIVIRHQSYGTLASDIGIPKTQGLHFPSMIKDLCRAFAHKHL